MFGRYAITPRPGQRITARGLARSGELGEAAGRLMPGPGLGLFLLRGQPKLLGRPGPIAELAIAVSDGAIAACTDRYNPPDGTAILWHYSSSGTLEGTSVPVKNWIGAVDDDHNIILGKIDDEWFVLAEICA